MRKNFDTFADLPVSLQKEAIREGEKLLDAQFTSATAADQRNLTWAGFLIAAATAALGGGVALFNNDRPDLVLGYGSIVFGIVMLWPAWTAIKTVRPSKFGFPGNRPGNWLPEEWDCKGTAKEKEQAARTDQARHLDACICDNRDTAEGRAQAMHRSFHWALWTVVIAGVLLVAIVTLRNFPIFGPISEFVKVPPAGEIQPAGSRPGSSSRLLQLTAREGPKSGHAH